MVKKEGLVYIADLRHNYQGVLSTDVMPLGIGYMKAYMQQLLPDVEVRLFVFPDKLLSAIEAQAPDVLMCSNYMWNERITLHCAEVAKAQKQETLVILGGPNYPLDETLQKEYLEKNQQVDVYITSEGDFYAAELVEMFLHDTKDIATFLKRKLHSAIYRFDNGEVICTLKVARSKNINDIPSPWLTGVMDEFFYEKLVPLIETNRGCPFTCTFCVQGVKWYTKVRYFETDRIKEELYYIAEKLKETKSPQNMLSVADSNFGMFERDIEIAEIIGEIQGKYNWPVLIDATTGKNKPERIIQALEKLNGALVMYQAVQSLDDDVLSNIKRSNISLESYDKIQVYVRGRGLRSTSDLILGLPGDSLSSHLKSVRKLINSGTHRLTNFQALMLKGTEMTTETSREEYGLQTKFRLIPKSYGVYNGVFIAEADEIIVSSNTLSFEDYLIARKYHFIISVFWNDSRFEHLVSFIEHLGYKKWDFIEQLYQSVSSSGSPSERLLENFKKETSEEIFDDYESLLRHYNTPEHIELLNQSLIGDNLIYKYRAMATWWYWGDIVSEAFSCVEKMAQNTSCSIYSGEKWKGFLNDWKLFTQHQYIHGKDIKTLTEIKTANLSYNLPVWLENHDFERFADYKFDSPVQVEFSLHEEHRKGLVALLESINYSLASLPMIVRKVHHSWQLKNIFICYANENVGVLN